MPNRPRLLSVLLTTLLTAAAVSQIASCGLDTNGSRPPEDTEACVADANCDDQNPCTIDACAANGICTRTALEDGPLPGQTAGDCQRVDCVAGVVSTTNDDADIEDDGESCTDDTCAMGAPVHAPAQNGTSCLVGGAQGTCQGGACSVSCDAENPCDDGNPCTEDACNAGSGFCVFTDLDGLPTPGYVPVPGDCLQHICVAGEDTAVADDTDVPVDTNTCTLDVCTMGAPTNPPVIAGEPCEPGKPEVCDGASSCVECNEPADCVLLPPDDDCQERACENHACVLKFAMEGTTVAPDLQSPGDCQRVVCDGAGATKSVVDDTDLPNDNNPCTDDLCTNGFPTLVSKGVNAPCGPGLYCSATDICVNCIEASQCPGTDDFCKVRTCTSNQCGWALTAAGTDLPSGQMPMDCKVVECDALGNIVTSIDTDDRPVDGNECTDDVCSAEGVPSNPDRALNASCDQNGGTVCNGSGSCMKADAQACGEAVECLSGHCVDGVCCNAACSDTCAACDVPGSVGTCTNVPAASEDAPTCMGANACDGAGACKKDDAEPCAGPDDCVSGACADGVCCDSACDTACLHCDLPGTVGICTMLASVEDTSPADVCAGTRMCDAAGVCKSKDGGACGVAGDCLSGFCVDDICCDTGCAGTCEACNVVGSIGVCSFVASGQSDPETCAGANACDGAGACKALSGQVCATDAACLSGHCVDGVCCDDACVGTCQACNVPGSVGTCAGVPAGQNDPGTCAGANESCNAAGACVLLPGEVCLSDAVCASGHCVDGVCCDTACDGTCQACNLPGSAGTCVNVPAVQNDTDTCAAAGETCDGAGACKLLQGVMCGDGAACLSGHCVDGVCCDTACSSTCQACVAAKTGGTDGVCSGIPAGLDPDAECASGECDAAGMCTVGLGQACGSDAGCASGHCADSVCCDTACGDDCYSCALDGKEGQCLPVASGTNDGTCTALSHQVCDGAGTCLGDTGFMCGANEECLSGNCTLNLCAP